MFVLVSRQWWATEGDTGEWTVQNLFSKSKGKKGVLSSGLQRRGQYVWNCKGFLFASFKEKACACLNSTESKGLARELTNKTPPDKNNTLWMGPHQSPKFRHFKSQSQVTVGGQSFSARYFLLLGSHLA